MPSLKSLRTRIKSVKNTRQITKTMKMVAAAKVRRARMACENTRPYAEKLGAVLNGLASRPEVAASTPLLAGRDTVKTVRLLIAGADRGLCGAFNSSLARTAARQIKEWQAKGYNVQLVAIGRKARDLLRTEFGGLFVAVHEDIGKRTNYGTAAAIANDAMTAYENGECDEVHVLYNHFESMLTQKATCERLVPLALNQVSASQPQKPVAAVDCEPDETSLVSALVPKNVCIQVFMAMLESGASEQAARMTAMDNATRNAGDMIQRLTLEYNRSRQAAITRELIEIISGAEAI